MLNLNPETVCFIISKARQILANHDDDPCVEEVNQPSLYLLSHPLVADYLLEGLVLHDYSCSE
jgi:hypothetical protein